jgi:LDH2 family malate/lactate/ureidoglycolate dehydrogenase
MSERLFPHDQIIGFLSAALFAGGQPSQDAALVARLMVEADLLGGDGHGLFRLPRYMARLRAGGFNLTPNIRIERQKGAMALLNGDNAMGHLVMQRATRQWHRLGRCASFQPCRGGGRLCLADGKA